MNKRGSIGYAVMFAVLLFFFALAIGTAMNSSVQGVRVSMGCTKIFSTLDFGSQATCTMMDIYSPFFVAIIFGLIGMIIGGFA
jgi:hypothetical protein